MAPRLKPSQPTRSLTNGARRPRKARRRKRGWIGKVTKKKASTYLAATAKRIGEVKKTLGLLRVKPKKTFGSAVAHQKKARGFFKKKKYKEAYNTSKTARELAEKSIVQKRAIEVTAISKAAVQKEMDKQKAEAAKAAAKTKADIEGHELLLPQKPQRQKKS